MGKNRIFVLGVERGPKRLGEKRSPMSLNFFQRLLFLSLLLASTALPTIAEDLVIPRHGEMLVLTGSTLTEVRRVSVNSHHRPVLAVHPSEPILASVTEHRGLVFWNLPSFAQASRHESTMLENITAAHFSPDGRSLYLLNTELRAIVVFDLASSKVAGVLAVPGENPLDFGVTSQGVWVRQEHGATFLSSNAQEGLLAQYRFPEALAAGLVTGDRFYAVIGETTGISSYILKSGRALGYLPTAERIRHLLSEDRGFYLLSSQGGVEFKDLASGSQIWSGSVVGEGADYLLSGKDSASLYVIGRGSGMVRSFDSRTGDAKAQFRVRDGMGVPIVVPGDL